MARASHPFASLRFASSLFLVLVGSLGAAASCGGGNSAGTQQDFINSYCDKLAPCCEQAGLAGDGAQCRNFLGLFGGSDYDPKAGEACLTAADKAADFCSNINLPECQGVFSSASGSVKPGGECTSTGDCAPSSEGTVDCAFAFTSTGGQIQKCQVQVDGKAGDTPCVGTKQGSTTTFISADDVAPKGFICDVAKNIYCDQDSKACTATHAAGDACAGSSFECGPDAFCDFGSQKCAAKLPAGSPCSGFDSCKSGTYCDFDTSVCKESLPDGSACTSSDECVNGVCVNNKCGSDSSTGLSLFCGSK